MTEIAEFDSSDSAGIITFLRLGDYGRLGNQLFQIAATLGTAHRSGLRAILPEWSFCEWIGIETRPSQWFRDRRWQIVRPTSFVYDERIALLSSGGGVSLEGYLQSDKYFDHCSAVVRQAILTPSVRRIRDRAAASHDVRPNNRDCAVHVRRGDYLKFSDLFAQLSFEEYYIPAMERMRRECGVKRFLVVSDDPRWCRENMGGPDIVFSTNVGTARDRVLNSSRHRKLAESVSSTWTAQLTRYDGLRTLRDMMLMSACRHHIIANSSFSWWSSWLAEFDDRMVIAPRIWFKPAMGHDTKDLYRDEMILM